MRACSTGMMTAGNARAPGARPPRRGPPPHRTEAGPQRAVRHQGVGEAIEALSRGRLDEQVELLAFHYERSPANDRAVEYLLKAGEKARQAYLNEAAIGYYQRALHRLDGSS